MQSLNVDPQRLKQVVSTQEACRNNYNWVCYISEELQSRLAIFVTMDIFVTIVVLKEVCFENLVGEYEMTIQCIE